jgi:starch-binding outer membrane protein, SusD/RagB family
MKKAFIYLFIACVSLLATSCEDVLDLKPLNSFSDSDIWTDPSLTEVFVNQIYANAVATYKDGGLGWGAQTDELYGMFNWTQEWTFNLAQTTADNQGSGSLNFWSRFYGTIRYANLFFQNIDQVDSTKNLAQVRRMRGEVYFLRALSYFELLNRFGGVPIITKVYSVADTSFTETRATWDQTRDFILSDIDNSIKYLPTTYSSSSRGRATKGAALALKSRLLLYAASPKNNPANDLARWTAAKTAAKDVMDLGLYSLYGNASTYNNIFQVFFNSEVIFSRVFSNSLRQDRYNTYNRDMNPNGYNGYSAYNPLQQLVDDFEMADGTPFSWSNTAHATAPYTNREPRFYADILYNNVMYKGRLTEFWDGGKESQTSSIAPWNASKTGYCIRKMVDENTNTDVQDYSATQWVFFRLAEIYLNYAEACAALGETSEALTYLNKIRTRAGLPNATATDLMNKIRHERRIELCFEGHRFWDIRRWKMAEVGSQNALGIKITKTGSTFTYQTITAQTRVWDQYSYFLPIPRSEILNNPNLVQNPGY